jgi:hypothetical protein
MFSEEFKKKLPHFILFAYEKISIRRRNSSKNQAASYQHWLSQNKPLPPPHIVKQKVVEEFKEKFNLHNLVETGTFLGDMVYSQINNFTEIVSIELDETLFQDAENKFKKNKNVKIIHGDSGKVLKNIINKFNEPCLFWLDGHYSAGFTAKGETETPILEELNTILTNKLDHIILIDDARCFTGENDYPTLNFLKDYVYNKKDKYHIEVIDDIIRLYPKNQIT